MKTIQKFNSTNRQMSCLRYALFFILTMSSFSILFAQDVKVDIRGIRNFDELPENCRKYVEFIEEQIGFPITMVSNGPGREDIIYRERPLKK